jgi:hypothetical protein
MPFDRLCCARGIGTERSSIANAIHAAVGIIATNTTSISFHLSNDSAFCCTDILPDADKKAKCITNSYNPAYCYRKFPAECDPSPFLFPHVNNCAD